MESQKKIRKVLISGGSGLVGMQLSSMLLEKGFNVSHLSRRNNHFGKVRVFRWDPDKQFLDPVILQDVDYIINLAGANIGEKRWTTSRKKEILDSRVNSTRLLYRTVSENNISLKAFISASAIGYYGNKTSERIFTEEDPPAGDFLAHTCKIWEDEADQFMKCGIRTVKIRTAVVLDKKDRALAKLVQPAGWGIFTILGTGKQYLPVVHLTDLCNIYLQAIQDEDMQGAFNAAMPEQVTQKEFMRKMSEVMGRKFFHPRVPGYILKLALGEMSGVIVEGSRISAEKIIKAGFKFSFPNVKDALGNIFSQSTRND